MAWFHLASEIYVWLINFGRSLANGRRGKKLILHPVPPTFFVLCLCELKHIIAAVTCSLCYSRVWFLLMLMLDPGWHCEHSTLCSCPGGLLHLPLAFSSCWRAVRAKGVVQHPGGPPGPCTHDGWWDNGFTLCHAPGRSNSQMNENRKPLEIKC